MISEDSTQFLGMLAEVASQTLHQQMKVENVCYKYILNKQQIEQLSHKCLLDLFTDFNILENGAIFSLKCLLMPTNCDVVLKSFTKNGVIDLMIDHLLKHIECADQSFIAETVILDNKLLQLSKNIETENIDNTLETRPQLMLSSNNSSQLCVNTDNEMVMITSNNCLEDHLYTSSKGPNCSLNLLSNKSKNEKKVSIKNAINDPIVDGVIATPAFPYVYEPVLPNISQVIEVKSTDFHNQIDCNVNEQTDNDLSDLSHTSRLALQYINDVRTASKLKIDNKCYTCKICVDKKFSSANTLIYHYRSHAGVHKPYECTLCNATFTRQHSLNYHMLIHLNKSRFVCDECGRNFRHPSHFKEHKRRHTGETPYECTECFIKFKTRNTYKRHLHTKHGKILTIKGIVDVPNANIYLRKPCPPRRKYGLTYLHQNIEAVARYERAQQQINQNFRHDLYNNIDKINFSNNYKVCETAKNNFEKLLQAVAIAEDDCQHDCQISTFNITNVT